MISDKFRRELREEAKLWQAEGLIDTSFYQQLSDRYQFNTLETASRNRFLSILISWRHSPRYRSHHLCSRKLASLVTRSESRNAAMSFRSSQCSRFLSVANSPIPKQQLPSKYARNKRAKQTPR